MPTVKVVFIGGTLALKPLALVYYYLIRQICGNAELITLPRGGLRSIDETYRHLERQIEAHHPNDEPVIIVGHSQGGLMAALYGATHANVIRVIAISAPFAGVSYCRAARLVPRLTRRFAPVLSDFTPGSTFLHSLDQLMEDVHSRLISIYTPLDWIVWPASSCFVKGARQNIKLPATANHINEILSRQVWDEVQSARDEAIWEHASVAASLIPAQRSPLSVPASL